MEKEKAYLGIEHQLEAIPITSKDVIPFLHAPQSHVNPILSTAPTTTSDLVPVIRHSSREGFNATISRINDLSDPKRRALTVMSVTKSINEIPLHEFPSDSIGYKPSIKGPSDPHWKEARNQEIKNWFDQEVAEISDHQSGKPSLNKRCPCADLMFPHGHLKNKNTDPGK